jgi:hypothetical protein
MLGAFARSMKHFHLICLFFLTIAQCLRADEPKPYVIRFGAVATDSQTGAPRIKETTTIPFKLRDTGFRFGFAVFPPDDQPYSIRYVTHLPSAPERLTDGFAAANPGKPTATITSSLKHVPSGAFLQPLLFDPGDPLGKWKIEIYVNGQLQKTITFDVVTESSI